MKTRFALFVAGILLVVAIAGVTALQAEQAGAAVLSPAAFIASLNCGANLTTLANADVVPAAKPLSDLQTCGSCSANPCKGAVVNNYCNKPGGGIGQCLPPLGNNCSDGVTWQCQCWSGPLP
ncbi:MAG TPA: hypothetical protein VKY89_14630 [Thermoanaerobaculia bacterium]|jgi:hypothetical protein|nr:hypothetical protein [Thermoanaerobaculia bacterium]